MKIARSIRTVSPVLAPKEIATGAAAIVSPGGCRTRLSDVNDGRDVAKYVNSIGANGFFLKYRPGMRYHQPYQLLDVARAMRIVRSRAKERNIDGNSIGILGFSGGGHLAYTLRTHFDNGSAGVTVDFHLYELGPHGFAKNRLK